MNMTKTDKPTGSGKPVSDFSSFCEGDIDPTLNKRIRTLIDCGGSYIVYLDDDNIPQFSMTDSWEQPDEYGEIANRVAHLQTLSMVYLDDKVIDPFRRLLAESMARICDNDPIKAIECVDSAEDFLIARSQERARKWYLQGALFSFGMALLFTGLLWMCRTHVSYFIGQNALHVLMGGLVGAMGAFTAMLYRFKTITIDASAGEYLHWFDGFTRLIVGFNAASFIALAVKSNIVLGFANASNHSLALLLAFCFAAGWSEKLMPSLISRFENSVLDKGEKPKQKPPNGARH